MFFEGDRVKLDINNRKTEQHWKEQPLNEEGLLTEGTVIEGVRIGEDGRQWVKVEWDNGHINSYYVDCLLYAEGGKTWALLGKKVKIKDFDGEIEGYIVRIKLGIMEVLIEEDNKKKICEVEIEKVEPIDGEGITIKKILVTNPIRTYHIVEGAKNEELDSQIITGQRKIISMEIWDEEKRKMALNRE